jgi:hypothetical protein
MMIELAVKLLKPDIHVRTIGNIINVCQPLSSVTILRKLLKEGFPESIHAEMKG